MMQVYDRALTSASVQTLAMISVLAVGLYVFQGGLDVIRSQILVRIGAELDRRVAPEVHRMTIDMPRFGFSTTEAMERGRYVEVLRNFFGSQGLIALFDLPWMPIFLIFVYFLHPLLGALTITFVVVQFVPGGVSLFDLTGYVNFTKRLRLSAGLYNLTDRQYWHWQDVRELSNTRADLPRFAKPGLNSRVTLTFSF